MCLSIGLLSCLPQGADLGPVLSDAFFKDLPDGMERTRSVVVIDTLRGAVNMVGGRAALHGDLDDLEEWADRDLTEFSKSKCEAWQSNPMQQEGLGAGWLAGEQPCGKGGGGHGGQQVELISQQCALIAKRANSIWGCTSRIVTSRSRSVAIPFYSELLRLIRSTVSSFDSTPPHTKSIDKLE